MRTSMRLMMLREEAEEKKVYHAKRQPSLACFSLTLSEQEKYNAFQKRSTKGEMIALPLSKNR